MYRDLKLDNIVVRERVGCRPTYELADLGESKFAPAGAAVRHTAAVGALLYMAPEMWPVSAAALAVYFVGSIDVVPVCTLCAVLVRVCMHGQVGSYHSVYMRHDYGH